MIKYLLPLAALTAIIILQFHNFSAFPIGRGFDTADHIQYINYLKTKHKIPLANEGWELHQAPLYYLLASLFPSIAAVRTMNLFFWFILLITAYFFFAKLFKNRILALWGTALTASLPVVLYLGPTISNEFFSGVMIGLVIIFYCLNAPALAVGLLLGLALLSKTTAVLMLAAIIIDKLIHRQRFLLIVSISLLIGGWFYARNLYFFRNPLATSTDFAPFRYTQSADPRNLQFFLNITPFFTMDLFRAHHYSFLPGTYFSWFYDGHNAIIPVQPFSKAGDLLILMSLPLTLAAIAGIIREIKKPAVKNRLLLIYPVLLLAAYVAYNFKLPYYSTVKSAFLVSAVIPFIYFTLRGIKFFMNFKNFTSFTNLYLFLYELLIIKNFWILSGWYR